MAINVAELNQFITTDEGKAWLDEQKANLLENKNAILAELKKSNSDFSELEQRFNEAQELLKSERAVVSNHLIDEKLTELLTQKRVYEDALPKAIADIKQGYSLTIRVNGDDRTAYGSLKDTGGNGKEAALGECVDHWAKSIDGKYFMPPQNTGGGAPGSNGRLHVPGGMEGMSGPELARLSDADFNRIRENELNKQGDNL